MVLGIFKLRIPPLIPEPMSISHTCLQLVLDVVQVQPFVDIVILALVVYMVGVGVVVDY